MIWVLEYLFEVQLEHEVFRRPLGGFDQSKAGKGANATG